MSTWDESTTRKVAVALACLSVCIWKITSYIWWPLSFFFTVFWRLDCSNGKTHPYRVILTWKKPTTEDWNPWQWGRSKQGHKRLLKLRRKDEIIASSLTSDWNAGIHCLSSSNERREEPLLLWLTSPKGGSPHINPAPSSSEEEDFWFKIVSMLDWNHAERPVSEKTQTWEAEGGTWSPV